SVESFNSLGPFSPAKYTTILLDLPGFGGSARPPLSWGLPEYGEFVGRFLKKTNLEPYGVIGHSNGGAIAIFANGSGIIKLSKLVLIGSSGVRSTATFKKTIHKFLAKIAKLLVFLLPKNTQRKIKKKLYTKIGSDYMVVEDLQEIFKRIVSYDVLADAKKITTPTLLIYGSNDLVTPLWQADKITGELQNSKLEIIDGAEHFPHKEQPGKVKKLIEDFLK
ncbi:MAG: alpha/beta hydrolase, partial [Candidatus Saccharimonadales bacterium]